MSADGLRDYKAMVASRESGGTDLGYHNRAAGTAGGRYGIIDPTWGGLMKANPELGLTWDNRFDPAANDRAMDALTRGNISHLRSQGVLDPTPSQLDLAHFLGPASAAAILRSNPSAPALDVLAMAVGRDKANEMFSRNPTLLRAGMTAGDLASGRGGGSPPMASAPGPQFTGPVQPTTPPKMPDGFGVQQGANPPPATVDRTGREGDPLIALGMGLMSGKGWRDGMGSALKAYQAAQAAGAADSRTDAGLANAAAERDSTAPLRAAQVAKNRADAWSSLHPTITPAQALQANVALSSQDSADRRAADGHRIQQEGLNLQRESMRRGDNYTQTTDNGPVVWTSSVGRDGRTIYTNTNTGVTSETLPPYTVSSRERVASDAITEKHVTESGGEVSKLMANGSAAMGRADAITNALTALKDPKSNAGAGIIPAATRALGNFFGTDVSAQQYAAMSVDQVTNMVVQSRAHGLGPMSDADRIAFGSDVAKMSTDPAAATRVLERLRDLELRTVQVADKWRGMSPQEQRTIQGGGKGAYAAWEYGAYRDARGFQAAPQPAPPLGEPAARDPSKLFKLLP